MSTKGTQFSRTMRYFREADLDEATAAMAMASDIVAEREAAARPARPRRTRKAAKPNAAEPEHTQAASA